MKRPLCSVLIFVMLVALCGCTGSRNSDDSSLSGTVSDLFTTPDQTETVPSTDTQPQVEETQAPGTEPQTQETEPDYVFPELETPMGVNIGFGGEKLMDDVGSYRVYSGAEMTLTYSINAYGFTTTGIGMLLFVDGQLQPYKTAEDDTYRYLHVFYPPNGEDMDYEVTFVPVTGEAGDMLEINLVNINFPTYTALYGSYGFAYTRGSISVSSRLNYQDTPGEIELPKVKDRTLTANASYVDLTAEEISGWSDDDLMCKIESHMYINDDFDKKSIEYYGVDPNEPLKVQVEMWGCPYAQYSLVLFVDNEPVYLDDGEILNINANSGQKTVVELELDISDSDGEVVVYGILVPRNYFSIGFDNNCYLETLGTYFIYSADTFAEFYLENYEGGE